MPAGLEKRCIMERKKRRKNCPHERKLKNCLGKNTKKNEFISSEERHRIVYEFIKKKNLKN